MYRFIMKDFRSKIFTALFLFILFATFQSGVYGHFGGVGLLISYNVITVLLTSVYVSLVCVLLYRNSLWVHNRTIHLLLGGVFFLIIPFFYTSSEWYLESGWRLAGLVAGMLFYCVVLQIRFNRVRTSGVVYCALLLIIFQASLALLQLFAPEWSWIPVYGRRIYGSFFQPNVLASFIATGLALAMMLFLLPCFVLRQIQYEGYRRSLLWVTMSILTALLVWIQSRAGWLGGAVVALLFLANSRYSLSHRRWALFATLSGLTLGYVVLLYGGSPVASVSHEFSNNARWAMLRDTLTMIVEKPFFGWGYGGFEYSFQHFRINQSPPTVVTEIARHPHNEILLWVTEGGMVSLVGVLLMLLAGLNIVRQALRHDKEAFISGRHMAGVPTALCITLVPIAVHSQLEYPFILSALHFLLFLLLLAMADRIGGGRNQRRRLTPLAHNAVSGSMVFLSMIVAVVMGFALKGVVTLNQVERFGVADVTPLNEMPLLSGWIYQERVEFDRQVNGLLRYNQTQDERLLDEYCRWAKAYLERRIDKNVFASLIVILQHKGQLTEAEFYRRDAVRLFPNDVRFVLTEGATKSLVSPR